LSAFFLLLLVAEIYEEEFVGSPNPAGLKAVVVTRRMEGEVR